MPPRNPCTATNKKATTWAAIYMPLNRLWKRSGFRQRKMPIAPVSINNMLAITIFAMWFGAPPLKITALSRMPKNAATMMLTAAREMFVKAIFSKRSLFLQTATRRKNKAALISAIGKCTKSGWGGWTTRRAWIISRMRAIISSSYELALTFKLFLVYLE